MARPRIIQLAQGEVSLQGFPKEVADALTAHIKAFDNNLTTLLNLESVVEAVEIIPAQLEPVAILVAEPLYTEKALGVRFDQSSNRTQLVTVAYDPLSGKAAVDNIYVADGKSDAVTKFKIKAAELNFV